MNKEQAEQLITASKRGNLGWDKFYVKAQMKVALCNGLTARKLYSQSWIAFWGTADNAKQIHDIVMATGDYIQCKVFGSDEKTQVYPPLPPKDDSIPF